MTTQVTPATPLPWVKGPAHIVKSVTTENGAKVHRFVAKAVRQDERSWGDNCNARAQDATYIETACNAFPALVEALSELADAEAEYRHCHDLYGGGDSRTGRAWDKMRRASFKARAALSLSKGESAQTQAEGEG